MRSNVWLMEDEEGNRHILVDDHPMPPVGAIQHFGSYDLPDGGGWGKAAEVAQARASELTCPILYHSDVMESDFDSEDFESREYYD